MRMCLRLVVGAFSVGVKVNVRGAGRQPNLRRRGRCFGPRAELQHQLAAAVACKFSVPVWGVTRRIAVFAAYDMWHAIRFAWFRLRNIFGACCVGVKVNCALQTSNQICDEGAAALGRGLSVNNSLLGLALVSRCAARVRRFFCRVISC